MSPMARGSPSADPPEAFLDPAELLALPVNLRLELLDARLALPHLRLACPELVLRLREGSPVRLGSLAVRGDLARAVLERGLAPLNVILRLRLGRRERRLAPRELLLRRGERRLALLDLRFPDFDVPQVFQERRLLLLEGRLQRLHRRDLVLQCHLPGRDRASPGIEILLAGRVFLLRRARPCGVVLLGHVDGIRACPELGGESLRRLLPLPERGLAPDDGRLPLDNLPLRGLEVPEPFLADPLRAEELQGLALEPRPEGRQLLLDLPGLAGAPLELLRLRGRLPLCLPELNLTFARLPLLRGDLAVSRDETLRELLHPFRRPCELLSADVETLVRGLEFGRAPLDLQRPGLERCLTPVEVLRPPLAGRLPLRHGRLALGNRRVVRAEFLGPLAARLFPEGELPLALLRLRNPRVERLPRVRDLLHLRLEVRVQVRELLPFAVRGRVPAVEGRFPVPQERLLPRELAPPVVELLRPCGSGGALGFEIRPNPLRLDRRDLLLGLELDVPRGPGRLEVA